jgi:hypothetical protein
MPGLVPGIHVLTALFRKDVDGRDKPYCMHTSDSIVSVGTTENMNPQSHLLRLWQT